ncbi:MAG: transcription antitermination factor NusB [Lachnospiraceae bacterium]|nr:transcription antitermination factor NusB [Lachnospiraceae bacterium]
MENKIEITTTHGQSRSQIREHIFKLVYTMGFYPGEEKPEQAQLYFEQVPDEEIPNPPAFSTDDEREYIRVKAQAVLDKAAELDEAIGAVAKGWKTTRMPKTDLAILRLALYEIRFDEEIPDGVAINEAVELAKRYGSDASPAFINGILARFTKEEKKQAESSGDAAKA